MQKYLDFGRFCIIFVPEFNEVETRDRLAIDPRQTRDNFLAKTVICRKRAGKVRFFAEIFAYVAEKQYLCTLFRDCRILCV